ncbi:MAG: hypothetical protein H0W66_10470 [Chthoniobacterales bacterium]|nr:hypothetical protein [Chthoniobacterales bacterium]
MIEAAKDKDKGEDLFERARTSFRLGHRGSTGVPLVGTPGILPVIFRVVTAKARTALPDSANRPKTKVAGSTKQNTRMQPALTDQKAQAVKTKK